MATVLVSNDDGIDAPGLIALAEGLAAAGHDVFVSAPERERSAAGHALTLHKPVRAKLVRPQWWAVSGSPADCVYMGLHSLMGKTPDVVVSGVNRGSNVGMDVLYSGTVAAAMEGCLHGVPGLAVSLRVDRGQPRAHWDTAVAVAARAVDEVLARGLPEGTILNINVPDVPLDALRGMRAAALGIRRYTTQVVARKDPRGRPYYWIGGEHLRFEPIAGTDGPLLADHWATVTPLAADLTRHDLLAGVADWTDEG